MNESRESKNAEQLEELLLLTEEIQEELEQKDQLIEELKTQLSESLTLNEKLNKENKAGNIQALKNDLKLADRALQIEKEKLRSANVMIGECQDTDLFVDESVDTAEQAICNLLMADLHRALQQLSQKERSFILDYYGMEKPSTLQLAKRYGISQPAAHKRLKKIEEKIKKLVIDF